MLFNAVKKTEHYKKYHEENFPWSEVIGIIFQSPKNMKKKGNKIEIETKNYYILCELKGSELHVINAKRR
ncbi:MAG: hypothetical protein HY517_00510 [Candidatus Aenigmarchaeota archaeon]|nr:hypothetical protein [Candidatus Aenigmarchaeota archaeon]